MITTEEQAAPNCRATVCLPHKTGRVSLRQRYKLAGGYRQDTASPPSSRGRSRRTPFCFSHVTFVGVSFQFQLAIFGGRFAPKSSQNGQPAK